MPPDTQTNVLYYGVPEAAAALLGAVDALRERVHLIPFDPDDHRRTIARAREAGSRRLRSRLPTRSPTHAR
jgi:hypothetical protein